ncbi:bifunctional DNA-formamidopyrimidine glycosylase/DNA-(apurinic or apyrimidinic site) lyase [Leucobacter sp. CSA2]|uniref:Bifunctional DNA-formamidopyrimidine glycosylase/DNA-(Apurinic or apyrimidinic site) lyase n=1 Tax=Leucobacter edaphi TaxID=2796472 RepID=A0A934QC45_9MICO|nr:bifunctional DNA-formamidopyrimidine glycosylase/DNA-(apurinic or apyrimidinic site) lyase [Leucobacter edaphi]
MPELPEVEVVRAGLAPALTGAIVTGAQVFDGRALKRHVPLGGDDGLGGHGVTLPVEAAAARAADFERRITGARLLGPVRRGKFLWVPIAGGSVGGAGDSTVSPAPAVAPTTALLAHLGMSGQMLLRSVDAADDRQLRIRLWIEHPDHGELRLDFADQRLFGSLAIDALEPTADGAPAGYAGAGLLRGRDPADPDPETAAAALGAFSAPLLPSQAAHIARDPLDPSFDDAAFIAALRGRGSGIKSLILNQSLVSGVGNIYADESLWRARLHPETAGRAISVRRLTELLAHMRDVFAQALAEGGTSFDEQYVNVNGQGGYFAHSLNAYGRGGEPCPRCASLLRRIVVGGRSAHYCAVCQKRR